MSYHVLAADPPWAFRPTYNSHGIRSVLNHYNIMTLDDIKALPVQTLAARDCVLFLWAIDTHIPEALEVITAWGFRYKSVAFTWVKTTSTGKYAIGCGWWTRANTETCLLATRGKPRPQAKDVRRLVVSPRREHSRKPDEIYDTHIPRLCTGPYIELFARTTRIGWDRAFSNEENKFD